MAMFRMGRCMGSFGGWRPADAGVKKGCAGYQIPSRGATRARMRVFHPAGPSGKVPGHGCDPRDGPDAAICNVGDCPRWGPPSHRQGSVLDGLAEASAALPTIIAEGRWRRWDWATGSYAEWHKLDPALPLVVEGCGAISRASRPLAGHALWLEHPADDRRRRAIEREPELAAHWSDWARQEDEHLARENPQALSHGRHGFLTGSDLREGVVSAHAQDQMGCIVRHRVKLPVHVVDDTKHQAGVQVPIMIFQATSLLNTVADTANGRRWQHRKY